MMAARKRIGFALVAALALIATDGAGPAKLAGAALPTPAAAATGQTPPPLTATATPAPAGTIVKYSGQLLDDRGGFVFFTTGDGFRLDPSVRIADAATGGPTKLLPVTRVYARASFDSATGRVVELALSTRRLPDEATYDRIKAFAVALSTPYANPDLAGGAAGNNGRPVLVTFTVEVPPKTPLGDPVYVATDTSGWSATAIRMDRIDALHYRVSRPFASGTRFLYRYTRGSWRAAERGQNGLEVTPRIFIVTNADVKSKNDIVYAWGDQDQFAPDLGAPIPSPFNPVPFHTPPH